jgi:hypothetical protein
MVMTRMYYWSAVCLLAACLAMGCEKDDVPETRTPDGFATPTALGEAYSTAITSNDPEAMQPCLLLVEHVSWLREAMLDAGTEADHVDGIIQDMIESIDDEATALAWWQETIFCDHEGVPQFEVVPSGIAGSIHGLQMSSFGLRATCEPSDDLPDVCVICVRTDRGWVVLPASVLLDQFLEQQGVVKLPY